MDKKILLITLLIVVIVATSILVCIQLNKENSQEQTDLTISYYNNPKIPEGFHTVNTETAQWTKIDDGVIRDWNKGLVIEDENGNQFVWVPVDKKDIFYDIEEIEKEFQYEPNSLNMQNNDEKQILKYGGFYISRYEAGVPTEIQDRLNGINSDTNDVRGVPVSKKGIIPWNYISLRNAKLNAESMYDNEYYSSDLPTLKQMMYIIEWINKSGYDIYDSSEYGNYSNVNFGFTGYYSIDYGKNYKYGENIQKAGYNMILSTGATDRNITNNIYDLAGNLWEYTDDYLSIDENEIMGYYCVGGHYDHAGEHFPIYSHNLKNVAPLDKVGFRVVLNLK